MFSCGLVVGITQATWPLVRIGVAPDGVRIAPRWRLLGIVFPPIYEFNWSDVRRVDILRALGRSRGLRFVLSAPAHVSRPYGAVFAVWPAPVRRLRVGLDPAALEAVLRAIPPNIPQEQRRWFGR